VVIDASSVALLVLILTGVGVGRFVHLALRDQQRRRSGPSDHQRRCPLRLVKNALSTRVRDVGLLRADTEPPSTHPRGVLARHCGPSRMKPLPAVLAGAVAEERAALWRARRKQRIRTIS
jgi:hypothetical protein